MEKTRYPKRIPGPGMGRLKLDDHGFTFSFPLRGEKTMKWSDVGSFVVITKRAYGIVPVHRGVGWKYSESYRRSGAMKAVGWLAGFDGQFPSTYGLKAQELAALLETTRQQALKNPPPLPYKLAPELGSRPVLNSEIV